ncbi:hypothetical protein PENTCL1PPCAC_19397, partial [Pristionchus entomophagus]
IIDSSEDCSLALSGDQSTLHFTWNGEEHLLYDSINEIEMRLFDPTKEVISHIVAPLIDGCRQSSIRIDPVYPIVFAQGEYFTTMEEKGLHLLTEPQRIFTMNIELLFGELSCTPTISSIKSSSLVVNQKKIPVSRELVSLHSAFFLNLFYGNFAEKNQNSYEIKDVDHELCKQFFIGLPLKKWDIYSVSEMAEMLSLADRFCAHHLIPFILQYLRRVKPSMAELKQLMQISTRFPNQTEFACGLLDYCDSPSDALALVTASAPELPQSTLLQLLADCQCRVANKDAMQESHIRDILVHRMKKAVITLVGHEGDGAMTHKYIYLDYETDCEGSCCCGGFKLADLWEQVPSRFESISINNGSFLHRSGHKGRHGREEGCKNVFRVHAYL